jgi:hypothetical protein
LPPGLAASGGILLFFIHSFIHTIYLAHLLSSLARIIRQILEKEEGHGTPCPCNPGISSAGSQRALPKNRMAVLVSKF